VSDETERVKAALVDNMATAALTEKKKETEG